MRHLLILYRLLFFALYTGRIVAEVYWRRVILQAPMTSVMAVRRRWAQRVLNGVGVRVERIGTPPDFPCLVMANHRSYLDPILILQQVNGYPVAKAELAQWPLIGKGAQWAGILYVRRDRSESRISTLKAIAEVVLEHGFPVILFPEGTTSDLPGMLPLKKGGFRTAAKWNLPVVPVAISFEDPNDYWIGHISFLQHAWKQFQKRTIAVRVCYGPAITGQDSATLETEARQWIENQLIRT